jgi:hypothetical protein
MSLLGVGLSVLDKVAGIASEAIEDPDKKLELQHEIQKAQLEYQKTVLTQVTTPKTDAIVKVMYALSDTGQKTADTFVSIARPVGGALLTSAVMALLYFKPEVFYKLMELNELAGTLIAGTALSLPAWGISRHIEKKDQREMRPVKLIK